GDHARAAHHGEACHHAVRVVIPADAEEVVQTAVANVSPREGPQSPVRHDDISVEVSPDGLTSPAFSLAEPKMDIGRNADETKLQWIEPELRLEHVGPMREQGLLDRDAREPATAGKPQDREELGR